MGAGMEEFAEKRRREARAKVLAHEAEGHGYEYLVALATIALEMLAADDRCNVVLAICDEEELAFIEANTI